MSPPTSQPQPSAPAQPAPMFERPDDSPVQTSEPSVPERVTVPAGRPPRTVTFEDGDDLDVPDFLK